MKNHINALGYSDGKIMITPHGFLQGKDKEEMEKSKKEYKDTAIQYIKEVFDVNVTSVDLEEDVTNV